MTTFHKINVNGRVRYREFDSSTGYYEEGMLTEEDVIQQLLDEAVESEIDINEAEIERAINYIPSPSQRQMVQTYITYLETVVESLE